MLLLLVLVEEIHCLGTALPRYAPSRNHVNKNWSRNEDYGKEDNPISLDVLKTAEREIIKQVRRECFQDEFASLVGIDSANPAVTMGEHKGKRWIKKSSKIIKLDPHVMDSLLRVGQRPANGSFKPL